MSVPGSHTVHAGSKPLRPPSGRRRATSKIAREKRATDAKTAAKTAAKTTARLEHAQELARGLGVLGAQDGANVDIQAAVHGVTHRGTVRIKITHIESVTDTMLDQWRFLCTAQGYLPTITFDAGTNEADVSCTPVRESAWRVCGGCTRRCARHTNADAWWENVHPTTLLFVCLFVVNVFRHTVLYAWS